MVQPNSYVDNYKQTNLDKCGGYMNFMGKPNSFIKFSNYHKMKSISIDVICASLNTKNLIESLDTYKLLRNTSFLIMSSNLSKRSQVAMNRELPICVNFGYFLIRYLVLGRTKRAKITCLLHMCVYLYVKFYA